jgi:hypothetical protein
LTYTKSHMVSQLLDWRHASKLTNRTLAHYATSPFLPS